MVYRLWLLAPVLLLAGLPGPALAQEEPGGSQVRYIEEIKQRNADYGPGCNGIGVSIPPAVDMPAELTSQWAESHSACVPGLRLVMTCLGDVVDADRVIGCTVRVADGQAGGTITCDAFTLIAPDARFQPDPILSEALSRGGGEAARPCAAGSELTPEVAIAAAFVVPAGESGSDVALLIDVDGTEVPAFLIPAGQLEGGSADAP